MSSSSPIRLTAPRATRSSGMASPLVIAERSASPREGAEHPHHRLTGVDALMPAFAAIDEYLALHRSGAVKSPSPPRIASPFDVETVPDATLLTFAKHMARNMQHGALAPLMGLAVALRTCATHELTLTPRIAHRLLLAATCVAVKSNCDEYYSVRYMARMGGVPEAADLGRIERHLFFALLSGGALLHPRDVTGEHGAIARLTEIAGAQHLTPAAKGRAVAALLTDDCAVRPIDLFPSVTPVMSPAIIRSHVPLDSPPCMPVGSLGEPMSLTPRSMAIAGQFGMPLVSVVEAGGGSDGGDRALGDTQSVSAYLASAPPGSSPVTGTSPAPPRNGPQTASSARLRDAVHFARSTTTPDSTPNKKKKDNAGHQRTLSASRAP